MTDDELKALCEDAVKGQVVPRIWDVVTPQAVLDLLRRVRKAERALKNATAFVPMLSEEECIAQWLAQAEEGDRMTNLKTNAELRKQLRVWSKSNSIMAHRHEVQDALDDIDTLEAENTKKVMLHAVTKWELEKALARVKTLKKVARLYERALASISGETPQSIAKFLSDIEQAEKEIES